MRSLIKEVTYVSERISEIKSSRSAFAHMNEKGINTTSNPSVSLEKEESTSSVSELGRDAIKEDARQRK